MKMFGLMLIITKYARRMGVHLESNFVIGPVPYYQTTIFMGKKYL